MNSKNNLLDTIKSYWWVIVLMLLPFIVYLLVFYDRPISYDTSDWGAFGNYYGGIIGIIPVFLLYITYREQRHANQIMLFNQRYDALFRNIGDLYSECCVHVGDIQQSFLKHFFCSPPNDINDLNMVIKYYYGMYRSSKREIFSTYEKCFRQFFHMLKLIDEFSCIPRLQDKKYLVTDISNLFDNDIKLIMFFYTIYKCKEEDKDFQLAKEYDVFGGKLTENEQLNFIIEQIVGQSKLFYTDVSDEVDLSEYYNETIVETITRIKRKS